MSAVFTVLFVAFGFGFVAYIVGSLVSELAKGIGADLDAISGESTDARHPDPPETCYPHRPIY